ncbi:DNA cytosine methyltransferase [Streptomyces sp. HUAS CX7]|uniref:DNA cytosine methyltransferase n=1 Tax=Streptomyces sp. HUAS CX7 TaxID=3062782 RepID=UPI0026EEB00F|nr:DNA cytosine methyltransferase [Streptomyces sp. HUAS CX7]WKX18708.1 DNA cytosine methyltransferase [Streptomyces sp. HUAS CX7]
MVDQGKQQHTDRTSVELFAGGGGLAMAVHNAGFRPLLVNEFAKRAVETLAANGATHRDPDDSSMPKPGEGRPGLRAAGWPLVAGDVRSIPSFEFLKDAEVDVLAGGPPCQPFSLGGVAKGDEDDRNMFPEMFRAIREMRPKAVICENVRGLLRKSFKPYFEYIKREMSLPFVQRAEGATWEDHDEVLQKLLQENAVDPSERYDVVHIPVNAADYGVPQIRQRVIIVAFRADLGVKWENHQPVPEYSEAALIDSMHDGTYWKRHNEVPGIDAIRERVMANLSPASLMPDGKKPWRTLRDAIAGIDENEGRPLPPVPVEALRRKLVVDGIPDHMGWPGARAYLGHTPNELDRPAKTVKAGVHGVPGGESVMRLDDHSFDGSGYRYMTVRETARVMTFPDDWTLAGPRGEKMRQLGNAVPVKLGEVFANAVREALDAAQGQA